MSLDDEILATGLGERTANRLKRTSRSGGEQSERLVRLFRQAQRRVERSHFRARKLLLLQERNRQQAQYELGQDPYVDSII